MKNIGILGGTFDPVHLGHLELGAAALRQFDLDEIFFIPSAYPPHKENSSVAPFHDRVAMLELVLSGNSCYQVSNIEQDIEPPNYTKDTLERLFREKGEDTYTFNFLTGIDAFLEIEL